MRQTSCHALWTTKMDIGSNQLQNLAHQVNIVEGRISIMSISGSVLTISSSDFAFMTRGLLAFRSSLSYAGNRASCLPCQRDQKVSKGVRDIPGNLQSATSNIPSGKALMYFGLFMATGVFFIFMAFTLFLPVIVLVPQKFAICFTLGCSFIIGSFFALRGPKNQFAHMFSKERLPFTLGFMGSMIGTLYVSMALHSYILSVLFSVLQVMALAYYAISYFPGGSAGLKFLSSSLISSVMKCFEGEAPSNGWKRERVSGILLLDWLVRRDPFSTVFEIFVSQRVDLLRTRSETLDKTVSSDSNDRWIVRSVTYGWRTSTGSSRALD
ncbi:putative mads box protein [Capsicum annuum]|nr:putative mads box protein [Capsicum annuum]